MLLHASCVAIDGCSILLVGEPGAGKSDMALRLIDGGAVLVADDQTFLTKDGNQILASPPPSTAGMMEIRHVGLVKMPFVQAVPVKVYVELCPMTEKLERLPDHKPILLLDQPIQRLRLPGFAASSPAKIRLAAQTQKMMNWF